LGNDNYHLRKCERISFRAFLFLDLNQKNYFMIIEFNTVYGQVADTIINSTRKGIMALLHLVKNVHKAEVTLKEEKFIVPSENKACSIKLLINGNNIVIHTRTGDFESASREALKELKKRIKKYVTKHTPPALVL
jgi:ribosome-associated translation inhibitor RaiA